MLYCFLTKNAHRPPLFIKQKNESVTHFIAFEHRSQASNKSSKKGALFRLLVEQSDLPIHQIAQLSGYENSSYFNKRFLENEQMAPSTYRNLFLPLS
ncbi:helix-turn-helix domain-containing protein [Paenibacillus baekrokdamisoli]|uniref:helix-turn-helix domain-containing protein n=1 Tax=Paenibacillus baekrokdamisoli TaxID=1712516 RepID=UPI000F7A3918